jgi:hypothetical protein
MDKIYMDAKDKNVAKVIIYTHGDTGVEMDAYGAYVDPEYSKLFTDEELEDAFFKGALIRMSMGVAVLYMAPTIFGRDEGASRIGAQAPDGTFIAVSTVPKKKGG